MIILCFIGITISTCALSLVAAIMNGFQQATHEKLKGVHADITMRAHGTIDYIKINAVLKNEFDQTIKYAMPLAQGYALLSSDHRESPQVVLIMAVDQQLPMTEHFFKKIVPSSAPLTTLLNDHSIIIGKRLAQRLSLKKDDKASLLFIDKETASAHGKISVDEAEANVTALFESGIDEYDAQVIFCSLAYFESLFPEGEIAHVLIELKDPKNATAIVEQLRKRFKAFDVYTWQDLYPGLLSALILEKYAALIILALIILVASMNMMALLFMYITTKYHQTAVLQAFGMSLSAVIKLFIFIALAISLSATSVGIIMSYLLGILIELYPICLPGVYVVSHIPIRIDTTILVSIFFGNIGMTLLAAWLPITSLQRRSLGATLKS